ncbi:hypothetical protein A9K55_001773 [Cordyceps militaris]|uniref:Uncharacterized protein n=1 Tax=Cordyceps militaris TaxID=73501 RepID=A0A2H4SQZ5_CORMI|nr:hypothetical protein A9K55_001773 [Cordyceps militaris]
MPYFAHGSSWQPRVSRCKTSPLTRPVALQLGEPRLALLDARPPSTSSKSQLASTAIAGLAASDSLDSSKFFPSAERLNAQFGLEIH